MNPEIRELEPTEIDQVTGGEGDDTVAFDLDRIVENNGISQP